MADASPERRDISGLIADIRVDVGVIKERTANQGKTLEEVKATLANSLSRGEYDVRHQEVVKLATEAMNVANGVRDDYLRRQGAQRVWRWVYGIAIAVLTIWATLRTGHVI